jgi:hypothetical protein
MIGLIVTVSLQRKRTPYTQKGRAKMTGVQESSTASNNDNAMMAAQADDLSPQWTDMEVMRAGIGAIPADKRQATLAALMSMIGGDTTDTVTESFNA